MAGNHKVSLGKLVVKRSYSGLGLFSTRSIKKDEFVIEYVGELLTNREADEKGGKYLFKVNSRWTIDGSGRKNIARYINHCCRPNSIAYTEGRKVMVYAKRAIKQGEEITYHYGKEYFEEYIKPQGCRCPYCSKK